MDGEDFNTLTLSSPLPSSEKFSDEKAAVDTQIIRGKLKEAEEEEDDGYKDGKDLSYYEDREEKFRKLMEQNERLIKVLTKSTSERNEIQRQKVEVQRMKEERKILFGDLNSITDPACRAYIEIKGR